MIYKKLNFGEEYTPLFDGNQNIFFSNILFFFIKSQCWQEHPEFLWLHFECMSFCGFISMEIAASSPILAAERSYLLSTWCQVVPRRTWYFQNDIIINYKHIVWYVSNMIWKELLSVLWCKMNVETFFRISSIIKERYSSIHLYLLLLYHIILYLLDRLLQKYTR